MQGLGARVIALRLVDIGEIAENAACGRGLAQILPSAKGFRTGFLCGAVVPQQRLRNGQAVEAGGDLHPVSVLASERQKFPIAERDGHHQRPHPHSRAAAGQLGQCCNPLASLGWMSVFQPELRAVQGQSQTPLGVARPGEPAQRRPDVVVLGEESLQPDGLLRPAGHVRRAVLGHYQEVCCMGLSCRGIFYSGGEALESVLPNGFQHPKTRLSGRLPRLLQ